MSERGFTVAFANPLDQSEGMTSWPTEGDREVNHAPHIEGLVACLDFLVWLLTGHIPHYRPAPVVRNDVASRAWTAPPHGPR